MRLLGTSLFVIPLVLGVYGCSSSSSDTGAAASGPPAIAITAPTDNASVAISSLQDGSDLDVSFASSGFTLKAPGTCAGAAQCGHVHLQIDGNACNDTANKAPYNAAGATSPITAGFDYCNAAGTVSPGAHVITLELRNDDHSPLSPPVVATAHVTLTN